MTLNQSDVDGVFDLLVEADPVPDPHTIRAEAPVRIMQLRPVHTGSEPMQTIDPTTDTRPTSPDRGRRTWMLAAAAAAIVVLGVGALFVSRGDDTQEPVQQPVPTSVPPTEPPAEAGEPSLGPADEAAAEELSRSLYAAVAAADIDAIMAVMAEEPDSVADRRMWEMNTYRTQRGPRLVVGSECHVIDSRAAFIDIGCEATMRDAVWRALDVSDLIVRTRYLPDGSLRWLGFETASGPLDWQAAHGAYATHLREFLPDEYAAVCDPLAQDTVEITDVRGLALTAECAELWVPLQDEVAAWVVETGFGSD